MDLLAEARRPSPPRSAKKTRGGRRASLVLPPTHQAKASALCRGRIYPTTLETGKDLQDGREITRASTAWQEVWIRRGSQGELRVQAVRCRVWVREAKETQARCWQLIATREIGAPDTTKYSFTNAVEKTSSQRLAYGAAAALLGRASLPGSQERGRHGRIPGAKLASLVSPRGPCPDGLAVHTEREAAAERSSPPLECL